jgi:hypothetical protein
MRLAYAELGRCSSREKLPNCYNMLSLGAPGGIAMHYDPEFKSLAYTLALT